MVFKTHFVLRVDGIRVAKHGGDAPLMSVIIKIVHLIGVINGKLYSFL